MRIFLVILLALVAIGAGGVWALGQFGDSLTGGGVVEAREPLVREPELVAANDTPAPAPAKANDASGLKSQPAAPKPKPAKAAEPKASEPKADVQAAPATPAPPPPAAETPAAQPKPSIKDQLKSAIGDKIPKIPPAQKDVFGKLTPESTPAPQSTPQPAPPTDAPAAAPPTQSAQADPVVKPQQVEPAAKPAKPAAPAATASAPAATTAASAAGVTTSLASQFKSRQVTYNRPPAKLALNKAVDVSLVINATANENAGQEALKGFPGTVVERQVDLSDIVSAQLTGVGFDITSQTVERQKLSGKTINRWQWRVTPTETGTRTLILEIFGYESGSLDAEPLDAYRDEIVVEVQQLDQVIGWAKSVQPVFAVLAAMAGAVSAFLAFMRFRSERKAKKTA